MLGIFENVQPKKADKDNKHDKWYTPPEVAERCWQTFQDYIKEAGFTPTQFVEPASGSGNFYKLLPEDNRVGMDIFPHYKDANVIEDDFLKTKHKFKEGSAVITNPPFGYRNRTSIDFFNKAAAFAYAIGVLIPSSWARYSVQNQLAKDWALVHSEDYDNIQFVEPNGKNLSIPVFFQVWLSPKLKIEYEREGDV